MSIELQEIKDDLGNSLEWAGYFENYSNTECIADAIFSIADQNRIDYAYAALAEWAVHDSWYIEEVVREFGIDTANFDFFRLIQQGQWYKNQTELYEELDRLIQYYIVSSLIENGIETITEETQEKIEEYCTDFDNNTTFGEIDDFIESLTGEEQDS